MAAQVDSPPTPVLECAYEHIGDPRRHWKLALMIYHGVLIAVVAVALAILIMVQAEIVNVGDTDDKDDWVEISSQIINGVFAWMAITNQPFYIYRLALTSKVLKATGEHWSGEKTSSIRAACYLSRHFSFVFVDSSTVCGNNVNDSEARNIRDNSDINGNLSAENGVVNVGNIIFLRNDARYLKTIFIILNCGCLFQYIMSGYMWGYDEYRDLDLFYLRYFHQLSFSTSLDSMDSTSSKREVLID